MSTPMSEPVPVIPEEWVEITAKAIWECADDEVGWDATVGLAATGDGFMVGRVEFCRMEARAALKAVYPLIREHVTEQIAGNAKALWLRQDTFMCSGDGRSDFCRANCDYVCAEAVADLATAIRESNHGS